MRRRTASFEKTNAMTFYTQLECDAIGAKMDNTWQQRHSALLHHRYRFIRQPQLPKKSHLHSE
jgi:hypothetical protein